MSMIRKDLFGSTDLVQVAIDRLRFYEPLALQMHPDGFFVADGGGKDSGAVVELVEMSGVKHTRHYHPTTVDPPELVRFLRQHRQSTMFEKPTTTMWKLIEKKMQPPTRWRRFCCSKLKEHGGKGRMIVTGIRWEESAARKGRPMVEGCHRPRVKRRFLHPIIDWTEAEVWEFHRQRDLPYCCLYDEGFKRLGCIGCPMGGRKSQEREFERWPHHKRLYLRAFARAIDARRAAGLSGGGKFAEWGTAQEMFDWWLRIPEELEPGDNGPLFG